MKKLLVFVVLTFLFVVSTIQAQTIISLEWDPNPASDGVIEYRLYHSLDQSTWARVATVDGDTLTASSVAVDGELNYWVLRAKNAFPGESENSNIDQWPDAVPSPPGNLRKVLQITIITSVEVL